MSDGGYDGEAPRYLFELGTPRHPAGRVRRGLDSDIKTAHGAGSVLAAAGVAALRSLADQIDQLERQLRLPEARPYDRVPLAQLVRQFDDTYARTFRPDQAADPLAAAFAAFATAAHDTGPAGDAPLEPAD